jgi:hypothetical protein
MSDVASETNLAVEDVRRILREACPPVHHAWEHRHGQKVSRSKPYCLRMNGPDSVGLDWEYSVVGAVEGEFRRRGYTACQELGTELDIASLLQTGSLDGLTAGINQRDLLALRREGDQLDLWIVEAKGKEAGGFEHYCFAEVLSQVFEVSSEVLTDLLGSRKPTSHGLCWRIARELLAAWTGQGYAPTITVAILVPNWRPDVVWGDKAVRHTESAYYARPLSAFMAYLRTGDNPGRAGRYKYERAFGTMLHGLQEAVGLRQLAQADRGLRFRVLTAQTDPLTSMFTVGGLDGESWHDIMRSD